MAITFSVDEVAPVTDALPSESADKAFAEHVGTKLHLLSHSCELLAGNEEHRIFAIHNPLMAAVHRAFSEHRPLRLSPDHIWLTICQGFAFHMELNAEALRERFVRHQGRADIELEVLALPDTPQGWAALVQRFSEGIREHVGPGVHRMLVSDFSTTTPVARTASEIVMMSAFRRYFDYRLYCICGIPTVTLEGTPEDWRAIVERTRVLGEYDLQWWIQRLLPVLEQLVATAQGQPDADFWQCIYMPEESYGSELATGWIARLFPYTQSMAGEVHDRNTSGLAAYDPDSRPGWGRRKPTTPPSAARRPWLGQGVSPSSLPSGVSEAPLTVRSRNEHGTHTLRLVGGFLGVVQDNEGRIAPEIGWAVAQPNRMATLLDRVDAEASTTPPSAAQGRRGALPAGMVAFYDRFGEATFHGHLKVLPQDAIISERAPLDGFTIAGDQDATPGALSLVSCLRLRRVIDVGDAGDPRWIGILEDDFCFVLVDPRVPQRAEQLPVVATSTEDLMQGLLSSGEAAFFDEPEFSPGSYLYDHLTSGDILSAAFEPGHPPPETLSERESSALVSNLWYGSGDEAERDNWWTVLKAAHGLDDEFRDTMKRRYKTLYEVLNTLSLR